MTRGYAGKLDGRVQFRTYVIALPDCDCGAHSITVLGYHLADVMLRGIPARRVGQCEADKKIEICG
ncbi:hypothetical protein BU24DRAFT_422049 [Aaosphaeria arxii CBS 175.79]|uniref:Uncharacterized protein n=1 Tax=Aaosphaeria arxii CBS 175.79 TaxID=1450172 RepID=A0A6A5XR28_9PLEO|nr:uncharacterized protein BU24DRAFT_422049 [Aaosphaeria arxii CBS 175.79]KAF2015738.1 hypothetical protein BU24DRAFT_422049 [Aaosphaeria arxii CBS 175.79]